MSFRTSYKVLDVGDAMLFSLGLGYVEVLEERLVVSSFSIIVTPFRYFVVSHMA